MQQRKTPLLVVVMVIVVVHMSVRMLKDNGYYKVTSAGDRHHVISINITQYLQELLNTGHGLIHTLMEVSR